MTEEQKKIVPGSAYQIEEPTKTPPTGLNLWYRSLHQVTADMAKFWIMSQRSKKTLIRWAGEIEATAKDMRKAARKLKL